MKLSDATIRALKPTGKQVMYGDNVIAGFGIRITPKGVKSFALMHGPQRTITTVGRYPIITLAEAREAAKRILAKKTLGQYQARSIRVSDALGLFVQTHCSKIKTGYEYERVLRRELFPSLQSHPRQNNSVRPLAHLRRALINPLKRNGLSSLKGHHENQRRWKCRFVFRPEGADWLRK